jgi:transcriptional regulator with XRE-family HTH domain
MDIALRIKELRKLNKMSQKDFGNSIGLDDSQLSKIERGILQPTLNQIMELSSIYKTTTDWLLLGKTEDKMTMSNVDFKDLALARLEIIDFQKEKINSLKEQLSELKYNQNPIILDRVAEVAPKLIKK